MPNYKQNAVTGETYQRANQVVVDNPLGGTPRISFLEQEVITLSDGRVILNQVPGCGIDFNAGDTFPLVDPATDLPTGESVTHADLQTMIYSLYKQLRTQADGV